MTQVMDAPEAHASGNGNGGTMVRRKTVMGGLAERYSMDPAKLFDTIKATCIKGGNATNEQVQAFLIVANHYNLDPFLKEIYAFPAKGGGIVPIVGVDGWSKIANATGMVDGFEFTFEGVGKQLACTCTLHVKGRQHPTRVTEYMEECYRSTDPWNQWPRRMLRHKAFMQCVRVAFGFGGIHDEDEAREIVRNESATALVPGQSRTDALLAKVTSRPVSEGQTFEAEPSALAGADAEDVIASAPRATQPQQDDPDVSGADAEPLKPDLSSESLFVEAAKAIAKTQNVPDAVFDEAMKKLRVSDGIGGGRLRDTQKRNYLRDAMQAGAFDWNAGKLAD